MRLINVETLALEEFFGTQIPEYAILSHTWGADEVSFQDWRDLAAAAAKDGFNKIKGACEKAKEDNLGYVWVDTNCIDKSSSAELTEAINSMFAWYRDSKVCYVYLADVPTPEDGRNAQVQPKIIAGSRWFTRGWTLQELLAPKTVLFYSSDWVKLGSKASLRAVISMTTGIDEPDLYRLDFSGVSVATKLSWVSRRKTTRIEDMAYCMLGLLSINLPLLYGEGTRSFLRLQEEIIRDSNDQTIFCWAFDDAFPVDWESVLAPSPWAFRHSSRFERGSPQVTSTSTYAITNAGLSIQLPVVQSTHGVYAVLDVVDALGQGNDVAIPLARILNNEGELLSDVWVRQRYPSAPISAFRVQEMLFPPSRGAIFVNSKPNAWLPFGSVPNLFQTLVPRNISHGLLVTFDTLPSQVPTLTAYPPYKNTSSVIKVASSLVPFIDVQGVIVQVRKSGSQERCSMFFGIKTTFDLESGTGGPDIPQFSEWMFKALPPIADDDISRAWEGLQRDFENAYREPAPEQGITVLLGSKARTEEDHELLHVTTRVDDQHR